MLTKLAVKHRSGNSNPSRFLGFVLQGSLPVRTPSQLCCNQLRCVPQVASDMPPAQLASTLVPIVRCAATNQLSLPFITAGGRDTLLLQLMAAEDPAVSVLATEAWCRCVCGWGVFCKCMDVLSWLSLRVEGRWQRVEHGLGAQPTPKSCRNGGVSMGWGHQHNCPQCACQLLF
jgi:hypothetical protein